MVTSHFQSRIPGPSSSLHVLSMCMPNSIQPANEHDTMIIRTSRGSHELICTDHYNALVAAHNSVPPDPTMTVDNVTQIFNKIGQDQRERVMGGLGIPRSLWEIYSTDAEKNHACADYYVNCHPKASWDQITIDMYFREEFALARESKSFMSTGKYCHYISYLLVPLLCSNFLALSSLPYCLSSVI